MSEPLQPFGFKESSYERVEQPWVCGRAADGEACPLGPNRGGRCRGTAECVPVAEADESGKKHWRCTRLQRLGGACADGPDEQGRCCNPQPGCRPVRGVRARRTHVTRWTIAAALGLLCVLLFGGTGSTLYSPGPLSASHGDATCADCHDAAKQGPSHWLLRASDDDRAGKDAASCTHCHQFESEAHLFDPHTADPALLAPLTEKARAAGGDGAPLFSRLFGTDDAGELACATCHREHRGAGARLVDDATCHACHARRFDTFSNDHPEFVNYPGMRETPIAFDHASHFGSHGVARDCTQCHLLGPDGATMPVRPFEVSCARCHNHRGAVTFSGSDDALVFLRFPKRGAELAKWAKQDRGAAKLELNPLLRIALGDPKLAGTLDLTEGIDAEKKRVAELLKAAFEELKEKDAPAQLGKRMEALFGEAPAPEELARLWPSDFSSIVGKARNTWFKNRGKRKRRKGKELDPQPPPRPGEFFWDDEKFVVGYLPKGHADPFVVAWMPWLLRLEPADHPLVQRCFQCHRPQTPLRWSAPIERRLKAFVHGPHLAEQHVAGNRWPAQNCAGCHALRAETEAGSSNFEPLQRDGCVRCHDGRTRSQSCLTCHRYHLGARPRLQRLESSD